MRDVQRRTLLGFAQLILALGALLFGPAGTFDFPQAWVYIAIFAASAALITVYLWRNDPKLLERRVNAGPTAEKEPTQKRVQFVAALAFIGILVVPGFDRRFGWSHVPLAITLAADVLVALGFFIVFLVFKENTFTAAVIEVATDQKVISTGPYAIVRHPMYAGALIMLFGTPLALGSWWGMLMFVAMTLAIAWRLLDEEQFLLAHLDGYAAYREKVGYRLIPRVW